MSLPPARGLVPMEAAMVILDKHEDEVLRMIEAGSIMWAWDIRGQDAQRREVRIWRVSLLHAVNGMKQPETEERSILWSLVPYTSQIPTPQLARLFTSSRTHIQNLIDAGLLHALNDPRPGQDGCGLISRESLITFLQSRRII